MTDAQVDALYAARARPWAQAWQQATDFDLEDPGQLCKPVGMLRGGGAEAPLQLLVGDDRIVILAVGDEPSVNRRIYLNRSHLENYRPSYFGDSVGHWEGDTLVVDTVGFNNKTFLSAAAGRHSEDLHVIERWRLIDGQDLEHIAIVHDPAALTAPMTLAWYYRKLPADTPNLERVCEGTPSARRAWLKFHARAVKQVEEEQKKSAEALQGASSN